MMDEETRKTKPDLAKSRHAATGLFKLIKNNTIPVSINELIKVVIDTFEVTVAPAPKNLFQGKGDAMTQIRGESIFIVYDDNKPVVRKRFSVAHELGHLYLGHLHGHSSSDLNTESFDQVEANAFAAHLLMPPALLRRDIKGGLRNPSKLAEKYNVSTEAMWFQLRNAGLVNLL